MDRLSKQHRSWNMSRIKSKDTKPEIQVRSLLHKLGFRFRLHRNDLPGKPDIVLPKYSTVIFVHGCYWHHHQNCQFAYTPKSKVEFWLNKFAENVARDKKVQLELAKLNWKVLVVWECELRDMTGLSQRHWIVSTSYHGTENR